MCEGAYHSESIKWDRLISILAIKTSNIFLRKMSESNLTARKIICDSINGYQQIKWVRLIPILATKHQLFFFWEKCPKVTFRLENFYFFYFSVNKLLKRIQKNLLKKIFLEFRFFMKIVVSPLFITYDQRKRIWPKVGIWLKRETIITDHSLDSFKACGMPGSSATLKMWKFNIL